MYPKHPMVEEEDQDCLKLCIPSVQDIMETAWKKYSSEVAPILQNLRWQGHSRLNQTYDAYSQAEGVEGAIDAHLRMTTQDPSELFALEDLRNQSYWNPEYKEGNSDYIRDAPLSKVWELVSHYQYTDYPCKPHHSIHAYILILSFMGEKLARIIQAMDDGKALVLQHSQLWNFADTEAAPVNYSSGIG
ncbi:hypothetical protein N7447_003275 [Penicillium robsamsonii]|uniref:uncharacterized protein n=1 Tax=Penicillium robsamsonii TaxID=1792511 RepID=UPI0025497CE0|nr:uncharacterized protein N7447_003275 [Penicillium robsamsonii]KAJ5826512.1 hypothetical protein N7447_003275 [Penicillium robsamsonii]